jgi:uncharacterized protein YfbU (UPF0304 family)
VVKIVRLYSNEEKDRQTKKEIQKLRRLFKNLPKDKMKAADGLIQEAAFMKVTLEETRHVIDQEGILEKFEQGAQKFLREHPATKVYNTMIQRYATVCKQLFDMIPDPDAGKQAEDELMTFVKRSKK